MKNLSKIPKNTYVFRLLKAESIKPREALSINYQSLKLFNLKTFQPSTKLSTFAQTYPNDA
ncbi:hypothetical protein BEL04_14930 [Mucilaginibacter sp. PPCGB 2223]|uniref:hypothetical protein n=1 Tax=Mucilaginibacter sp. PPCGB 2223 TaxID=1886027 RepID=UPI00082696F8|nr:hypothetical protein [Mucilaginibacter sp. PPCGB 2223]OCX51324.1 hypothetical protein BEL04_14930 [Mucilaginibacter sp. PPCGB 2223]